MPELSFWFAHLGGWRSFVLSTSREFHHLMMMEYHTSELLGHLGTRKIVNLLYYGVWWPKLYEIVTIFYKECKVYAKIKDSTIMPPGTLQL